jgi:hypothetical protein
MTTDLNYDDNVMSYADLDLVEDDDEDLDLVEDDDEEDETVEDPHSSRVNGTRQRKGGG